MDRRSHKILATTTFLTLAALVLGSACEALAPMLVDGARKFLVGTATQNYQSDYTGSLEKMVDILLKPALGLDQTPPPAGGSGDLANAGAPTGTPPAAAVPLGLDIVLLRETFVGGKPMPVPIQDGDKLRDGHGRDDPGDNIKISVRPTTTCYLYVVAIDATGWAQPLFPNLAYTVAANPVAPERALAWPDGPEWFYLDRYRGVETFYFIASRQPMIELERVLTEIGRMTRPATDPPARVEEPPLVARGIEGKRLGSPAPIIASNGVTYQVPSQAFLSSISGSEIVVTRWFQHE